jgi:hypothetical protein
VLRLQAWVTTPSSILYSSMSSISPSCNNTHLLHGSRTGAAPGLKFCPQMPGHTRPPCSSSPCLAPWGIEALWVKRREAQNREQISYNWQPKFGNEWKRFRDSALPWL